MTQEKNPTLRQTPQGLILEDGELTLSCDFTQMIHRIRRDNLQRELLVRAAKRADFGEDALALDATAGLGEDSFLLAAAGFRVRLYEYNPLIAALLRDGLERGKEQPEIAEIVSRMELTEGDSIEAMQAMAKEEMRPDQRRPDLILLDPMFPKRVTSGISKKKLQLFKQLEKPCEAEREMLEAALALHPYKVIVKRPIKGPYLGDRKPGYSIEGKVIRYDCLVLPERS